MVQRVEAWGNVLEFPDGMSDEDMASAILENEVHLNPNASTSTKVKSFVSRGIDAGLSMLTPKKSIADQAQERSASTAGLAAPQVKGVPVRQDFYNRMVAETPKGQVTPGTGIVARTRNAAAQDTESQKGKRVVAKALVSNEPVPEDGGFINSAGRTIGQNIKGAGQIAADFIPGVQQDNAVKRYGQAVIDANPTAVNSLEDIADKPGTAVAEATGNTAPSMAGMVGARAVGQGITALSPFAGPAAPLVAAAGQVVSWLGPAAIASLPSYSGIRDKQTLNDPRNQELGKAKAIALLGAGAVGAIEQAFGPQQWALAALTKEGRAQLAEKFAATTLPGAIGKGIAKGAAIEGSEELAQNPIEQLASFDNPTTPENLKETAFGGAMGAIGGGVLGGGTGALARQNPTPTILGKPVTEISNGVLNYTAARGSNRAKAAAQAELARRAAQGVDPAVANQPESTSEAVERIISTGRDKAQEIREGATSEPDAIQSGIFDEPDHIVDANNMIDEGTGGAVTDNPTPEPVETINAQLNALAEGRKPGVLLTPGEPLPAALPPDVRIAMVPNRGMLLYRDDATLQAALNGQMGTALGYGIDEKPGRATQVVTARDPNGTVIQDVATDGNPAVQQAAATVAGPGGSVEVRPVQQAMAERGAAVSQPQEPGVDAIKALKAHLDAGNKPRISSSRDERGNVRVVANFGTANNLQSMVLKLKPEEQKAYDAAVEGLAFTETSDGRKIAEKDLINAVRPAIDRVVAGGEAQSPAGEVSKRPEGQRLPNGNSPHPVDTEASHAEADLPNVQPVAKANVVENGPQGNLRPLVESLIKRRAAAKESGKERTVNSAITRAKEVMDGKRSDTELESKWFRVQAAGMKKEDPDTAEILKRIGETVKAKETASEAPKFSRSASNEDIEFAHEFLTELSAVDELFRYPISHKTSLQGVMEEVYPGAKYVGDGTRADERDESGADHRYVFKSPFGKQFYVYERDNGEVFIDVSHFTKGEFGQAVYAAVANWAYNTKRKFIGDPAGLTADSLIRRTSNMLSSALRFGTAKHLEAAPQQIAGDPKNGVPPLDWSGDDVAKIRALIHTFVTTLDNKFPELKGYRYDFGTRQFVDRRGRPVGPDRFTYAEATGMGSAARAGKATMRRGILIQSLVSSTSGARPGILEQVLHGGRAFVLRGKLEGIFSRKNESDRIASVRQRLKAAEDRAKKATHSGGLSVSGDRKSKVQTLVDSIRSEWKSAPEIVVVSDMSDSAIPERVRNENDRQMSQGAVGQPEGFFYKGKVYIVASEMRSPDDVVRVLFHETLGHFGLRGVFGEELKPILKQVAVGWRSKVEAKAEQYGLDMSVEKDRLMAAEEVLAELAQTNPQIGMVQRAIAIIRAWLRKNVSALANMKMTDAEIIHRFLIPARRFVQEGRVTTQEGLAPAFSRPTPGNNAAWDAPEPSMMDDLIYKLQNKNIDLKRVVEAVKATGAQIADKWNAYLQEELFHGRAAKRVQDFVNDELRPIIQGMKLRGLTVDELDQYLHARHAEEANKLIAQRDPNMPDGGSGMTTKDAKAYLAGLPADKKQRLENVAKMVDAVIAKTRDLYLSYGLIDQATSDSWKNMFQHYVPLMREDQDGGMGIGQGFSIKGKEVKHRTGSKRKVVDILANIALQRERAIVRGEKNRVAVSLAGLAKLNPNPDFWTFDKVPTEKVLNEVTGQAEERPVPNFKNRDNVVVAKIKDGKGNVIERAVIFNENDERAMRMTQALKNLDADQLGGLLGVSAAITRYFAAINTQYNPVFGIVNLTRDLQGSLLNLSSTPIAGHKAEVLKNVLPAIGAIYVSSRGDRKGKQATSPMAVLWDEMQQEGGMTGYRDLFRTSEDRAKAIKRELDPTAWMNNPLGKVFTAGGMLKVPLAVAQQKAKWIFDWLSDYNQTLEGAMRLSVYKTAIDNGISKQRAASIAKNISVNFNRKGQSGQQAGALYAFFNAAMQGTARIGETMFDMDKGDVKTLRLNRAGKTIMIGGITLGALQALALAAAGFGDDEPPEFVRERSLIIPIGDKKYVTIPMPLGFHAIPNIGRLSTEYALGGFKKPADYTAKLFSVFAEAFNPIGNAGFSIQTIAPTAIDPLVALAENKDWTGKPIAKEDFNKLSPTPGFSRNKDTASLPSKWIAEAINAISGGNKYVPGVFSPTADQIDYLAGQLTGGVGREAGKTQQTISAMATGEDLPPHKVPLLGRFYGNAENQSSQGNAFYSNLKSINEIEAELKGRRKDGLPLDEFKAEHPEYQLVARANLVERIVSKQRKIKSDLIAKDAPRADVKAVEDKITNLMAGFNKNVKELQQRPQAAH